MSRPAQNFANHARLSPLYHYVLQPILLVNVVFAARTAMTEKTWVAHWLLVVAIALLLVSVFARSNAMTVQDRLIVLEMRLRCERLLPAELFARFDDLRIKQVVALRFAGDRELPELVRRTLAGEFAKTRDIKRAITDWKADWHRV